MACRYSIKDVRQTYKTPDTWWGYFFMSHISGYVTWLAANLTPFPPEFFTVSTLLLGLAGVPFFLHGDPNSLVIGALFAFASDVMDGVNGKLARLHHVGNALGGYLDTSFDFIKSIAFLVSLPLGQYYYTGDTACLWIGLFTTLAYATVFANENLLGRMRAYLPGPNQISKSGDLTGQKTRSIFGHINSFFRSRGLLPAPGGSEIAAFVFMVSPFIHQVKIGLLLGGIAYLMYGLAYTTMLMVQTKGLSVGLAKDVLKRQQLECNS